MCRAWKLSAEPQNKSEGYRLTGRARGHTRNQTQETFSSLLGFLLPEQSGKIFLQSRLTDDSPLPSWLNLQKFSCSIRRIKPTTLLGTLVLHSTWSSVGATEAGPYSIQKADNSVEERIAAARSDEGWSHLLKSKLHQSLEFAAWGNGRGRGWANGGGGGGGFANARYGGGWGNGGGWRNGSGAWGNGGGRRGFVNW